MKFLSKKKRKSRNNETKEKKLSCREEEIRFWWWMGVCVSDIFFGGHFSERSRTEKYNTKEIVILLNY